MSTLVDCLYGCWFLRLQDTSTVGQKGNKQIQIQKQRKDWHEIQFLFLIKSPKIGFKFISMIFFQQSNILFIGTVSSPVD